jgi:twitching motility protein PilT
MVSDNSAYYQRLGDFLLAKGLITPEQLDLALTVQAQSGMRLGSVLLNLELLSPDDLLDFLAKRSSLPAMDLYKLNLTPDVLGVIPFSIMKKHQVLPIAIGEKSVFVAMVVPTDESALNELSFLLGKTIEPIIVPEGQMKLALEYLEQRGGKMDRPLVGTDLERMRKSRPSDRHSLDLQKMFTALVTENASDLLLSAGVAPCLRNNCEIIRLAMLPLTPEQAHDYAFELMDEAQKEELDRSGDVDFAYMFPDLGRFRLNVFKQKNTVALSARRITDVIPSWETLGLPGWLADFALKPQGLIMITGPAGHGKTTTLAALVDMINTRRKCNIITIEDPIEYLHQHRQSNINQREVGLDTPTFAQGLHHIFRQAPDVIVIGEMRDPESFEIAIKAAETGHLVLTTFHSTLSTSAVERLIDVSPPTMQHQVRVQLAESMLLILNQRLLPHRSGKGRVLALESLTGSPRVRNFIREGKTHQIRNMYQQSAEDFLPIDISLAKLVKEGKITQKEGLKYCDNAVFFNELLNRGG